MDIIRQGLTDQFVPCFAAMVDEIVVGFEDTVREPVVAHELCQTFSTGLSSGDFGGRPAMVMLAGTLCHLVCARRSMLKIGKELNLPPPPRHRVED